MTLSIEKTKKHGLEMWAVVVGGEVRHTFFYENAARSKMIQLQKTIGA